MKPFARFIFAAALPLSVLGCATSRHSAPFEVLAGTSGTSCSYTVGNQTVSGDQLPAIARQQAAPHRRAIIRIDSAPADYRCLGGAIYLLQAAGFQRVETVAADQSEK